LTLLVYLLSGTIFGVTLDVLAKIGQNIVSTIQIILALMFWLKWFKRLLVLCWRTCFNTTIWGPTIIWLSGTWYQQTLLLKPKKQRYVSSCRSSGLCYILAVFTKANVSVGLRGYKWRPSSETGRAVISSKQKPLIFY
jgi:hypothetical protein